MCLIEDQSWIDCIDITGRWDAFVSFHLYGNKGVSLPLWPIRPRWFHTYRPCAEPLGDGHEGMWARFGSQGSIALNWNSRYSGTRYSGTWLYKQMKYGKLSKNFTNSLPFYHILSIFWLYCKIIKHFENWMLAFLWLWVANEGIYCWFPSTRMENIIGKSLHKWPKKSLFIVIFAFFYFSYTFACFNSSAPSAA